MPPYWADAEVLTFSTTFGSVSMSWIISLAISVRSLLVTFPKLYISTWA